MRFVYRMQADGQKQDQSQDSERRRSPARSEARIGASTESAPSATATSLCNTRARTHFRAPAMQLANSSPIAELDLVP